MVYSVEQRVFIAEYYLKNHLIYLAAAKMYLWRSFQMKRFYSSQQFIESCIHFM